MVHGARWPSRSRPWRGCLVGVLCDADGARGGWRVCEIAIFSEGCRAESEERFTLPSQNGARWYAWRKTCVTFHGADFPDGTLVLRPTVFDMIREKFEFGVLCWSLPRVLREWPDGVRLARPTCILPTPASTRSTVVRDVIKTCIEHAANASRRLRART
eukprot:2452881-Prymnesium_polylepis.1